MATKTVTNATQKPESVVKKETASKASANAVKAEPVNVKADPVKAAVETVKKTEAAIKKVTSKAASEKKAEKKAPGRKPGTKKEVKVNAVVEYYGKQVEEKAMIAAVKKAWIRAGHKVGDIRSMDLYIKPEEGAVYYVINGTDTGAVSF